MGSRAGLPRIERDEILDTKPPEYPRPSAWSIPVSMVAVMLIQTAAAVLWLDNRLAPIQLLVEQQKELTRRVELLEEEHRRYREAKP